jgi:hypothetical protein
MLRRRFITVGIDVATDISFSTLQTIPLTHQKEERRKKRYLAILQSLGLREEDACAYIDI